METQTRGNLRKYRAKGKRRHPVRKHEPSLVRQRFPEPIIDDATIHAADDATIPAAADSTKPTADDATKPTKPAVDDATKPAFDDATKPAPDDATKPALDDTTKPAVDDATKRTIDDAAKRKNFREHLKYCYRHFCLDSIWDEFNFDDDPDMYATELLMHNQARLARHLKEVYAVKLLDESSRTADGSGNVLGTKDELNTAAGKPPVSATDRLRMEKKDRVLTLRYVELVFPGKSGETIIGTLEAHVNGFQFIHSSSLKIYVMYKDLKDSFCRAGDDSMQPLLHFHSDKAVKVGTESAQHIQFRLVTYHCVPDQFNGRKYLNDGDRYRDLEYFVEGVQDKWSKKGIPPNLFDELEYEFEGVYPSGNAPSVFALTLFALVRLYEEPFLVVKLSDIEIVNLAELENGIDMTIIFQDLNNVLEIKSIPVGSLPGIKCALNQASIKYYVNKEERDWQSEVQKIAKDLQGFVGRGGWEELEDPETKEVYYSDPDVHPCYTSDEEFYDREVET